MTMPTKFGTLTLNCKREIESKTKGYRSDTLLDVLFQNAYDIEKNINTKESDRQIALTRLRLLISELQEKRH